MGATNSRNVRKIIWCDTEGGVRGVPVWDCAFIAECEDKVHAVRMCTAEAISGDKKRKIRNSVPSKAYTNMTKRHAQCVLTYRLNNDHWALESWDVRDVSIPALVSEYLTGLDGGVLAAWNMRCHDRHVLQSCVGESILTKFALSDPLIDFRTRIGLPKNTMSNAASGTPRNLFCVSHSNMGPAHTSITDALNMRLVCLRAFYNVQAAAGSKQNLAVRLSQQSCVKCTGVSRKEMFNATYDMLSSYRLESVSDSWEKVVFDNKLHKIPLIGWMWESKYWKPRELDPRMREEFTKRLVAEFRKAHNSKNPSIEQMEAIESVKTEVDLQSCIEQFAS